MDTLKSKGLNKEKFNILITWDTQIYLEEDVKKAVQDFYLYMKNPELRKKYKEIFGDFTKENNNTSKENK